MTRLRTSAPGPWAPLLLCSALLSCCAPESAPVPPEPAPVDKDGDGFPIGLDCDDQNPAVHPGAQEVCGGGDEDCDGMTDAADDSVADAAGFFADADDDGYGDATSPVRACEARPGVVADGTDVDDRDSAVWLPPDTYKPEGGAIETGSTFCADHPGRLWDIDGDINLVIVAVQNDLDALRCVRSVSGDVDIIGGTIANVNALSRMRTIGGSLTIASTELTNLDGLSGLTAVGGGLQIEANYQLRDLDGLSSLSNVGDLIVRYNCSLRDVEGLAQLAHVDRDVTLEYNDRANDPSDVDNWDGPFCKDVTSDPLGLPEIALPSLTSVGGSLNIAETALPVGALPKLSAVGGRLSIRSSGVGHGALPKLNAVGGDLSIIQSRFDGARDDDPHDGSAFPELSEVGGNLVLEQIAGPAWHAGHQHYCLDGSFPALHTVGGQLVLIYNDELEYLHGLEGLGSFGGLTVVGARFGFHVEGLPSVTSLRGDLELERNFWGLDLSPLASLTSISGRLRIVHNEGLDNDSLGQLAALTQVGAVRGGYGPVAIYGNSNICQNAIDALLGRLGLLCYPCDGAHASCCAGGPYCE